MSLQRNGDFALRRLDPDRKEDLRAVAELHLELIGRGEIAQLGRGFLQKICYDLMVREGLISAFLFRVHGEAAGFIACTPFPISMKRRMLRKHWPSMSWAILQSVVRNPLRLRSLARAAKHVRLRDQVIEYEKEPAAEILAIGVCPEYRTPQFIYQTGQRISEALFSAAVSYFKDLGLGKMKLFYPDFGKETLLFYQNLGGRIRFIRRRRRSICQISFDFNQLNI